MKEALLSCLLMVYLRPRVDLIHARGPSPPDEAPPEEEGLPSWPGTPSAWGKGTSRRLSRVERGAIDIGIVAVEGAWEGEAVP